MIKTIKKVLAGLLIVPAMALSLAVLPATVPASAACDPNAPPTLSNGVACSQGADTPSELFGDNSIFTTIVNILLFIIGAISVIMLIIGGIRYTVSGGDAAAVTAAKNTILYAIIGLVVAFLAFAVVNWVLGSLTAGS